MIVVNLKGGLGNQMFQYAAAYSLSLRKKVPILVDLRLMREHKIRPSPRNVPRDYDLDIFGIEKNEPSFSDLIKFLQFFKNYRFRKYAAKISNFFGLPVFYENERRFNNKFNDNTFKAIYLDGLWQSENYFKDYRTEVLNLFNFNEPKNKNKNKEFVNKINFSKSVCLNVRRTDFINNPEHNVVNLDYYKNSIMKIKKLLGSDITVYIFSDDLDWCKNNFNFIEKKVFVEHLYSGKKFYDYLYLMSTFQNFIIPNSSFAWWAAWLSVKTNKIIMTPDRWSGLVDEKKIDIVPSDWIRINY
jgi:hypothetical protein